MTRPIVSPVEKFQQISVSLFEKTRDKSITWDAIQSRNKKEIYETSIGNLRLEIENVAADITIRVYRPTGELVDKFSDADLNDSLAPEGYLWYTYLKELLSMAARQASGSDAILDELISTLKSS